MQIVKHKTQHHIKNKDSSYTAPHAPTLFGMC